MKAIIVEPENKPCLKEIENDLDTLQEIVGGDIEHVTITDDICIICNEEGKLIPLPFNRALCGHKLMGTFIICAIDHEEGNYISLEDKDIGGILSGLGYLSDIATYFGREYKISTNFDEDI